MVTLEIKQGIVYVNGKITTDPNLIGYAILDIAEQKKDLHISTSKNKDVFKSTS